MLLRTGLPGEGHLNAALKSLNWFFQVASDGPHMGPEEAEQALWRFAQENAHSSKDMQIRRGWVRDKCRRLAWTLEPWMNKHGLVLHRRHGGPRSTLRAVNHVDPQQAGKTDQGPRRRSKREVAEILAVADQALELEQKSGRARRSKVEHALERFVDELITVAKAAGGAAGFVFTISHKERDKLSSERKGPRYERLLGKIIVPGTGLPALRVLEKGVEGQSFTKYALGLEVDDGGEHASLSEGILACLSPEQLGTRYTPTDLARVQASVVPHISVAQRASGAEIEIPSITPTPQFSKTTTTYLARNSEGFVDRGAGVGGKAASRAAIDDADAGVVKAGLSPLLCSHPNEALPPCCTLNTPELLELRGQVADRIQVSQLEVLRSACLMCPEGDVARAARHFSYAAASSAEIDLDDWCHRQAADRRRRAGVPVTIADLRRAARAAMKIQSGPPPRGAPVAPVPISIAAVLAIAASGLGKRHQQALYVLACHVRANAIQGAAQRRLAANTGLWDVVFAQIGRKTLEGLPGVSRNTYSRFVAALQKPGTSLGFAWSGPTIELVADLSPKGGGRARTYAVRAELLGHGELLQSLEAGLDLLRRLQQVRRAPTSLRRQVPTTGHATEGAGPPAKTNESKGPNKRKLVAEGITRRAARRAGDRRARRES